jgi:integrase
LRLKWSDVDWNQRQLTIGADGLAKNHKSRMEDVNSSLEAHLKEMARRKAPDSEWLFPSPQRGHVDRAAQTFRETLLIARAAAGAPKFRFHDSRHFFISMCVMSGIDFMTIAKWVGHQDGERLRTLAKKGLENITHRARGRVILSLREKPCRGAFARL